MHFLVFIAFSSGELISNDSQTAHRNAAVFISHCALPPPLYIAIIRRIAAPTVEGEEFQRIRGIPRTLSWTN